MAAMYVSCCVILLGVINTSARGQSIKEVLLDKFHSNQDNNNNLSSNLSNNNNNKTNTNNKGNGDINESSNHVNTGSLRSYSDNNIGDNNIGDNNTGDKNEVPGTDNIVDSTLNEIISPIVSNNNKNDVAGNINVVDKNGSSYNVDKNLVSAGDSGSNTVDDIVVTSSSSSSNIKNISSSNNSNKTTPTSNTNNSNNTSSVTTEYNTATTNYSTTSNINESSKINNKEQSTTNSNATSCHLRQTMAWHECVKKVDCPFTCMSGDDCTFPYCNMFGECECRQAFCRSASMCQFFRIECNGTFVCLEGSCICG